MGGLESWDCRSDKMTILNFSERKPESKKCLSQNSSSPILVGTSVQVHESLSRTDNILLLLLLLLLYSQLEIWMTGGDPTSDSVSADDARLYLSIKASTAFSLSPFAFSKVVPSIFFYSFSHQTDSFPGPLRTFPHPSPPSLLPLRLRVWLSSSTPL